MDGRRTRRFNLEVLDLHHGPGKQFPGRPYFWVNYNDLTTTSLEIMVSKGNHPQMALIQVSETL